MTGSWINVAPYAKKGSNTFDAIPNPLPAHRISAFVGLSTGGRSNELPSPAYPRKSLSYSATRLT